MKKARELMSPQPVCCRPEDSVYDAVQVMEEENCGAVPIVNGQGKCVGIVTDRDISLAIGLSEAPLNPRDIPLTDVMTDQPITVHPEDDIQTVIQRMEDHQVRRLPVVDEAGRCIGIIAQADLARQAESPQQIAEVLSEISR